MKARTTVILTLVFMASLITLSTAAQALTVAFPPDESYVEHEAVNIVVRFAKDSLDSLGLNVNNFQYPKMDIASGSENFCLGITLAPGLNNVQVVGYKNKNKVAAQDLSLYLLVELDPEANRAPRGFKKYVFHVADNEKSCKPCHGNGQANGQGPPQPESIDSPCYGCHRNKIVNNKYLHAPAEEWACMDCHESGGNVGKYSLTGPSEEICINCHDGEIGDWKEMKMMHGPTAVGQCTVCHDPHGTDWLYFLSMNTTDLCIRCHVGKESGQHVIAGFYGSGHPTRGVPDPTDPEKEFSCAGCHSPHASDYDHMLKQDNSRMGLYCNSCHKK